MTKLSAKIVSIAGTNGKGSTAKILANLLLQCQPTCKVGLYTSPHLVNFNERIVIDGHVVDDQRLCEAFENIQQACHERDIQLTFFEYTTLAALFVFKHSSVDIAVLEIGLGGRLDAVNIVDADIAVITSIGIDHVEYLGNSREQIAMEKAGILRAGKPAVCVDDCPPQSLLDAVDAIGARFVRPAYISVVDHCLLPYQSWNAALAVMDELGYAVEATEYLPWLTHWGLTGRQSQHTRHDRVFMLDVAHNLQAVERLVSGIEALPKPPAAVIFAAMADKEIDKMLARVLEIAPLESTQWLMLTLDEPRAMSAEQAAESLRSIVACSHPSEDIEKLVSIKIAGVTDAINWAIQSSMQDDTILVFGSFYTVGEVVDELDLATGIVENLD